MTGRENLRAELRRQRERLEGSGFREALKAARLLRRAREQGSKGAAAEVRALEGALEKRFRHPAWRGAVPPPTLPREWEEKVRAWVRDEVAVRFRELERVLTESLETLMETDVRIIRELRQQRNGERDHGREPM